MPTIKTYDSIAEVARDVRATIPDIIRDAHSSWSNGSVAQTVQHIENGGDASRVSRAEKLIDQLQDAMPASFHDAWHADVMGAFPNVPAYLAGEHACMSRRMRVEREFHPVHVIVATVSSGGVPAKHLEQRGTAILALAMGLQAIRGVRLYVTSFLGGGKDGENIQLIRIPSEPLSIAEASLALCSVTFTREMLYPLSMRGPMRSDGGWPRPFKYDDPQAYMRRIVTLADFPADTITIPAPTVKDDDWRSIDDEPVAWVRRRLAPFLTADAHA
jgi:hypothetical protein